MVLVLNYMPVSSFPYLSILCGSGILFTQANQCVKIVCFISARLSLHKASVAFSTSGDGGACQPVLWGLRQEGMSSTF